MLHTIAVASRTTTRPRQQLGLGLSMLLLLAFSLAAPVTPARGAAEPVDVEIGRVQLGQGGSMRVTVLSRCSAPFIVQELLVGVSQQEGTRVGFRAGEFGLVCDGRWHRTLVEVFGPRFEPGLTQVDAQLDILDPIQFDPAGSDRDTRILTVEAPAEVEIGNEGLVRRDGSVRLPVWTRCQRPWVVAGLSVSLSQGSIGASAFAESGLTCDGQWHKVRVLLDPEGGRIVTGGADALAFFDVLDPDSFDPVDQGQDSERIRIKHANAFASAPARTFR